jgi:hypothetical protein
MWKRKKAKEKKPKGKARQDPEVAEPPLDDGPTEPHLPTSSADATVWQGQPGTADTTERPDPDSGPPDTPRPAEADAPTVAIRPEFKRSLPDAPSLENDSAAAPAIAPDPVGEETVQVGRRPPPEPTVPPGGDRATPHDGPDDTLPSDETPTVPLGRRRD